MIPTRFRKKPVEIVALQFTGENFKDVEDFTGGVALNDSMRQEIVRTLEGDMKIIERSSFHAALAPLGPVMLNLFQHPATSVRVGGEVDPETSSG